MRFCLRPNSGMAQMRWVLIVILLIGIGGALTFLLRRPPPPVERLEEPFEPVELSRTNLVLIEGHLQLVGADVPFTGLMVEHYADGQLRSRSAVSNGLLQGLSEGYYTNGQIQVSEHFIKGVSHGVRTKWYPDGAKQSEAEISDGKLQGLFRRWHENGVLSEQLEFVADQPEGESLAYFPSGYLKARVVMKDGKPVEQKFWKDGEMKP